MSDTLYTLIWYSIMIVAVAWAGGIIPIYYRENKFVIHLFISFGAGILLGAAFLHMIPESAKSIGHDLGLPLLAGFLVLYIAEKFVMTHPCPAENCEQHTVGISAFIGLSLHSLITGLALGSGILVPKLGLIVFLAIVLHKLPASLSLASLLVKDKYSTTKIAWIIFIFSIMVPIGAFLTYFFAQNTSETVVGMLVAFSGGTFLHVASDDLLPEVHQHGDDRKLRLIAFIVGLLVIWSVTFLEH